MMTARDLKLCTFSKSQILGDLILESCPLKLKQSAAKQCQCRKRMYHVPPADLRVLSCTYPSDWRGKPVDTPTPHVQIDIEMGQTTDAPVETSESHKAEEESLLFGKTNDMPLRIPIIGLTGPKGSGKTLAGLTLAPADTIVVDIEDSSVTYNLPLKQRYSMYDEVESSAGKTPTPRECWEWFQDLIYGESLDCRVLFVDPITDLQAGLVDWVRSNPAKFGKTENQYKNASGLLWADVKSHLKMVLGKLSRRVECFIFTAHMGSVWKGGAPVAGKSKAKGVDTFYELASLYLHLQRMVDPATGKQPAAPTASIAPPIGKSRVAHTIVSDDGEVKIIPILPPTTKDFTWKKFREYVAKPPNYQKLKKEELAQNQSLTEDEKLELAAQTAADNRATEEAKLERMEAVKAAAQQNQQHQSLAAAAASTKNKAAKPSSDEAVTPESSDLNVSSGLSAKDLIPKIKQQMKELEMSKEQMVQAVEKRGGKGAKMANLTLAQLQEINSKLWSKLSAKDVQKDLRKKS